MDIVSNLYEWILLMTQKHACQTLDSMLELFSYIDIVSDDTKFIHLFLVNPPNIPRSCHRKNNLTQTRGHPTPTGSFLLPEQQLWEPVVELEQWSKLLNGALLIRSCMFACVGFDTRTKSIEKTGILCGISCQHLIRRSLDSWFITWCALCPQKAKIGLTWSNHHLPGL